MQLEIGERKMISGQAFIPVVPQTCLKQPVLFYFIVIIIFHISKSSQAWFFLKSDAKRGIAASGKQKKAAAGAL